MLDSELINYKHYMPWVDFIILSNDEPELWILEIAGTKNTQAAIDIIRKYTNSEPFETNDPTYNVGFIACLWIRYKRREISWSTFLYESGQEVDGNVDRVDCEYFYGMYNDFEESEYSNELETVQSGKVFEIYQDQIKETKEIYDEFKPYFRMSNVSGMA